jgi:hypothetical protein
MASKNARLAVACLAAEWSLPSVATLGSSVRAMGFERELRRRMPIAARKSVSIAGANIVLCMPEAEADAFNSASRKITETLEAIGQMPVLPSEAEDILSISSRERHKWLKDGRLKSVGTRTVKMRGRAKSVTFHVFDPRHIEEVLDGDLPALWREEDGMAVAEHRRRAAAKAALRRKDKRQTEPGEPAADAQAEQQPQLNGWEAFEAEGFLR